MRSLLAPCLLTTWFLVCGSHGIAVAAEQRRFTHWEPIPLPTAHRPSVTQIAMDRQDVLWALACGGVHYWDGEKLRPPTGDKLTSGYYLSRLLGGHDRELYVSQSSAKEPQGKIYRLRDGESQYVTDFHFEVSTEPPGLYVSAAGNIINWGNRFLSVFVNGRWHRHEASLSVRDFAVAEADGKVVLSHNDKFYVIDKAGGVQEQAWNLGESIKVTKTPRIAVWGKDRILVQSQEAGLSFGSLPINLFAFDVNTGRQVDLDGVRRQLEKRRAIDFFSLLDGAVWLRSNDEKGKDYVFFELSPKGTVTRMEGTAELAKQWNPLYQQFPQSTLRAEGGAVWISAQDGSIARIRGRESRRFDWQDGLSMGVLTHVLEGRESAIYVASPNGIAVWRPDGPRRRLPGWVNAWREYRTASYGPIRDSEGHIWMLLADRPGEISRWDGDTWQHHAFPVASIYQGMADDQGHLLLVQGNGECFDVGRDGVKRYDDLRAALVAARARGATRMDTDDSFQGCYFRDRGEIWFGEQNRNHVFRYDGQRWDQLPLRTPADYMHESAAHGVLVHSQDGKLYAYDQGRLKAVTELGSHNRLLWSSKMFQPFDSAIWKMHPRDYVVVEDGRVVVPVLKASDAGETRLVYEPGDALPTYPAALTGGWKFGHWTGYAAAPIHRIWGNRVIECEWQETPVLTRWYEIRQVLEDRGRNLWVPVYGNGRTQVFMKRMGDFRVSAKVDDKGTIRVTPARKWHGGYAPRVFWRARDGRWQGGKEKERIDLDSWHEGTVEIVAMDRQGGTTDPLHVKLPR